MGKPPPPKFGDPCMYRLCADTGTIVRNTQSGFTVVYCPPHNHEAEDLFDAMHSPLEGAAEHLKNLTRLSEELEGGYK